MVQWFEASLSGRVRLDTHTPPLNVLLVWHTFLQDPVEWTVFVDATKLVFSRWNLDALSTALKSDESGEFHPSWDCMSKIHQVYKEPDVLAFMNMAVDYVANRQDPDDMTQKVIDLFYSKRISHTITTADGEWKFHYNFHSAVQRQLDLAERVLQFSWHRMHTSSLDNERGFRPSVKRYRRLMTLAHRLGPIEEPEGAPLGFTYLDIDLVWRTHILEPREYCRFCSDTFGGLVLNIPSPSHIPREETALLDHTSLLYEQAFQESYAVCLCWPCVDGRRKAGPASWVLKCLTRPVFGKQRSVEVGPRRSVAVSIPLAFTGKQCSRCGSHPRRLCRERDIARGLEYEPLLLQRSTFLGLLRDVVFTIYPIPPDPMEHAAPAESRDSGTFLFRSAISRQRPSQSSSSSTGSKVSEPGIWDGNIARPEESHEGNLHSPVTPDLTGGSTCSCHSDDEEVPLNDASDERTNLHQTSRAERTSTPRTIPEPGVWLDGQTEQ
ncbi:hypothetical protein NW752_006324 [Fusarium irregulare]|uniref:Uncharacterized protein n=1 Tax=Fusarium irregulare TaxID=2494466 RepID=A0A9W8PNM8_9HYPO|nr:hypothetical protein NW766_006867 [Fusarium irregulare]KAJ4017237.1 hypothetical protein NW752_006324 [Fusarium irregulare]